MNSTITRHLTLHEAMILALLERKLESGVARMSNAELEAAVRERDSYWQKNGDHPDAAQVFLRARQCPEWFDLVGDATSCDVGLRPMECGGA